MTSKPTTPEPEVPEAPEQSPDPRSPEKSRQHDGIETQHDSNGDDGAQSSAQSPAVDSGDKPAQTPVAAITVTDTVTDTVTVASEAAKSEKATTSATTSGEASAVAPDDDATNESSAGASGAPPLPNEPLPDTQDDGWDCHWDPAHQSWFFHNRITGMSTWENPRMSSQPQASADANANTQLQTPPATAVPPLNEPLPAGGYNPAIHGDYDPNAWYAKGGRENDDSEVPVMDTATAYAAIGSFNRFTGRWQGDEQNPDRHNDEAKSRRQMNAFFDVDAAANAHDGRSLKAERSGKKPTKSELKQFKEKRRAKKEEKRRAWLRD
ncbi:putative ww domain-containing protein [Rosellinia necatrix]|uniref:Putative ww domain-containing protein n=1 Tax=Rosellinia necatrix TaxID=77044 RepID=A0A1W2TRN6_ROSNE|nr:putative ww domain-containing protein [Rosellinia necatrix]